MRRIAILATAAVVLLITSGQPAAQGDEQQYLDIRPVVTP